jgi:hypothetical protein
MFLPLNYLIMLSTPQFIYHRMRGLSVNNEEKSEISGFCHGAVEAYDFLGHYVVVGSCLLMFQESLSVPPSKDQPAQEECTM